MSKFARWGEGHSTLDRNNAYESKMLSPTFNILKIKRERLWSLPRNSNKFYYMIHYVKCNQYVLMQMVRDLYLHLYLPNVPLVRKTINRKITYQITTFLSLGRTMGSPSLQPNAFANIGAFNAIAFTRAKGAACTSLFNPPPCHFARQTRAIPTRKRWSGVYPSTSGAAVFSFFFSVAFHAAYEMRIPP